MHQNLLKHNLCLLLTKLLMSKSSRRFSQRNLQRPPSQSATPVRRVQGNLSRSSSLSSTPGRGLQIPQATTGTDFSTDAVVFDVSSCNPINNFLIGLREIVLKALLVDIESAGGFASPTFSLKRICDLKPDIYGSPGSDLRRQVQNKVHKLRQLAPYQYLSVLNYYRVSSGALTRSFRLSESAVSESDELLSEPVTPVRLHCGAVVNTPPSSNRQQLVPFETPPPPKHTPHRQLDSARRLAMNTQCVFDDFTLDDVGTCCFNKHVYVHVHVAALLTIGFACAPDVIVVNLQYPERNREVMVLTVNDVQHQGNMYNCFTIMLRVDPRDAAVTDRCTAYVVSENEILISYPALEYFFFTDSAARNERLKIGLYYDPRVQLAQDICINDVRRAPQRVVKRLLLRFPADVTLANVFNRYSYVIRSSMPMDYAETSAFGGHVKVLTCHMQWMIADLNTHRHATIEADEATPLDLLQANFARMFQHGA